MICPTVCCLRQTHPTMIKHLPSTTQEVFGYIQKYIYTQVLGTRYINEQCFKLKLQTLKSIGITPIKPLSPLHKMLNEGFHA